MRTDGLEFRHGFRADMTVDGRQVTVRANHAARDRMPKPSEMSRMVARGRPVAMVRSTTFEWAVLESGLRIATVRHGDNGLFTVAGRPGAHRDLAAAVEASLPSWQRPANAAEPHEVSPPKGP